MNTYGLHCSRRLDANFAATAFRSATCVTIRSLTTNFQVDRHRVLPAVNSRDLKLTFRALRIVSMPATRGISRRPRPMSFALVAPAFDVLFAPRDSALSTGGPQIAINTGKHLHVGLRAVFPQGRNFKNYQFQDTITHTSETTPSALALIFWRNAVRSWCRLTLAAALSYTSGGGFTALGNFVQGFSGPAGAASKVFGNGAEKSDVTNQAYFINDNWRVVRT